jgi:hypothetical protein
MIEKNSHGGLYIARHSRVSLEPIPEWHFVHVGDLFRAFSGVELLTMLSAGRRESRSVGTPLTRSATRSTRGHPDQSTPIVSSNTGSLGDSGTATSW